MKTKLMLLLMLVLMVFGCEITINPSIGTLRVTNETGDTIWLEIDDGATIMLYPNEFTEQSWELINSQIVNLKYWNTPGNIVFINLTVLVGNTTIFDVYESIGQLEIANETSGQIWYEIDDGVQQYLASGADDVWNWDLLEYENTYVNIDYDGYHVFSGSTTKNVESGYLNEFHIYADGGGIQILNDFIFTDIYEVYLSPSSDGLWGSDDLTGIITAGSSVSWTVESGYWDIKLVDENGSEYVSYDNYIALDTTTIFYVDGWRKSGESGANKKDKLDLSFPMIIDKTELK